MIKFAAICPHPPILLPSVGTEQDKKKLKKTLSALAILAEKFQKANPDTIIISSPHPDWGFNVPLYSVAKNFKKEIKTYLTELEPPSFYFEKGKKLYHETLNLKHKADKKSALIASGDLSHCLKEDGPYGFNPQGPKFDKALIKFLKAKDVESILRLDEMFPEAGECGLRSFCFLLGILEARSASSGQAHSASSPPLHSGQAGQVWQPEILSYEAPFGVGYLVVNFKLNA